MKNLLQYGFFKKPCTIWHWKISAVYSSTKIALRELLIVFLRKNEKNTKNNPQKVTDAVQKS